MMLWGADVKTPTLAVRSLAVVIAFALVALAASPSALARVRAAATQASPALDVLFIGNSYTRVHDLPHMVQRIAEGMPDAAPLVATSIANPGWDLSRHWYVPETRDTLANGHFTHVVLQG